MMTTTTPERRKLLLMGLGVGVMKTSPVHSAALDRLNVEDIIQPATPNDKAFIERAFEMRKLAVDNGDQGYGAVVVLRDKIVGQSWSRVILDQDPTAHAEIAAIRDAARRLKSRDLEGTALYSSSRPCPMCEAAAYWAGVIEMVHGQDGTRAGRPQLCR